MHSLLYTPLSFSRRRGDSASPFNVPLSHLLSLSRTWEEFFIKSRIIIIKLSLSLSLASSLLASTHRVLHFGLSSPNLSNKQYTKPPECTLIEGERDWLENVSK